MAFQVRLAQTAKVEIDTAYFWLRERNPVYAILVKISALDLTVF